MVGPAPLLAYEELVTEASAIAARRPALASAMLADAAHTAIIAGDPARALAASRRANVIARRAGPRAVAVAGFGHAVVMLIAGGAPAKRRAWSIVDRVPLRDPDAVLEILLRGATALYWSGDYPEARRLLERIVERARTARSAVLATALDTMAVVDFRLGAWPSAEALSSEARRVAAERGSEFELASAMTTLARIAAARGREAECRALLSDARALARARSLPTAYAASAAGLLELSLGRSAAAIRELEPLGTGVDGSFSPVMIQWLPELIEAYVRSGRAGDAGPALARLEAAAHSGRAPLLGALAARCRGLLATRATLDLHFSEALRLHLTKAVPFELARTELCYGERLRRVRRRADAIVHLRVALAIFERIGAVPWAERARHELAPLRRPHGARVVMPELTPHERAVAELVRRGATNREAGSALFVTPKTIEYHLASIYRKVGVRSRTELAIALFRTEPTDIPPAR